MKDLFRDAVEGTYLDKDHRKRMTAIMRTSSIDNEISKDYFKKLSKKHARKKPGAQAPNK